MITSYVKIYGETLGRGNGKGKDWEETMSILSFRNSKKACIVKAGGRRKGEREHLGDEIREEGRIRSLGFYSKCDGKLVVIEGMT